MFKEKKNENGNENRDTERGEKKLLSCFDDVRKNENIIWGWERCATMFSREEKKKHCSTMLCNTHIVVCDNTNANTPLCGGDDHSSKSESLAAGAWCCTA